MMMEEKNQSEIFQRQQQKVKRIDYSLHQPFSSFLSQFHFTILSFFPFTIHSIDLRFPIFLEEIISDYFECEWILIGKKHVQPTTTTTTKMWNQFGNSFFSLVNVSVFVHSNIENQIGYLISDQWMTTIHKCWQQQQQQQYENENQII